MAEALMQRGRPISTQNRYAAIIEAIFLAKYKQGQREVAFERQDIANFASELGISLPKNLGDVVYSFRYRAILPESILALRLTLDSVGLPHSWPGD